MRDCLPRAVVLHWNCTANKFSESMSDNDTIMWVYDTVRAGNIYAHISIVRPTPKWSQEDNIGSNWMQPLLSVCLCCAKVYAVYCIALSFERNLNCTHEIWDLNHCPIQLHLMACTKAALIWSPESLTAKLFWSRRVAICSCWLSVWSVWKSWLLTVLCFHLTLLPP